MWTRLPPHDHVGPTRKRAGNPAEHDAIVGAARKSVFELATCVDQAAPAALCAATRPAMLTSHQIEIGGPRH